MKFEDMQPLMLFCFLAKHRSLSKVSDLLDMHRTTVVRNIQKLEQSQGKQLMLFEPSKVVLTEDGEVLFDRYLKYFDVFRSTLELDLSTLRKATIPSSLRVLLPTLGAAGVIRNLIDFNENYHQVMSVVNFTLVEIYVELDIFLRKVHQSDIAVIPRQSYNKNIAQVFDVVGEFLDPVGLITSKHYAETNIITHENYQSHIFAITPDLLGKFSKGYEYVKNVKPRIYLDTYAQLTNYLRMGYGVSFCSIFSLLAYPDTLVRVLNDIEILQEFVIIARKSMVGDLGHQIEVFNNIVFKAIQQP